MTDGALGDADIDCGIILSLGLSLLLLLPLNRADGSTGGDGVVEDEGVSEEEGRGGEQGEEISILQPLFINEPSEEVADCDGAAFSVGFGASSIAIMAN